MKELLIFFAELLVISAIFCLGYMVIRQSTTPTFKRFYLLAWMLFSFSFPLITIEFEQSADFTVEHIVKESIDRPEPNLALKEYDEFVRSGQAVASNRSAPIILSEKAESVNWIKFFLIIYIAVSSILFFRILLGLIQIVRMKRLSKPLEEQGNGIFLVEINGFKGASFFNWIFIGKSDENEEVILQHERIHRKLGHSLDILLSHVYCALFWINPLSWVLKKYIGINTELEADAGVVRSENKTSYANLLLSLTKELKGSSIMNHFSAFHLKTRIVALTKHVQHRKWVTLFSISMVLLVFFFVSCEAVNSPEIMVERLGDVKTITTRFTSHQSDTQQKTGKIVAIATFSPEGVLEELVEQTTYPYDREFEVKKSFWEAPEKAGIPYIMDGLSLGQAEKSILYGNDWPSAYYKHLYERTQSKDMPWKETIEVDNPDFPTEIEMKHEYNDMEGVFIFGMPDVTEYFEYDGQKVVKVLNKKTYKEYDLNSEQAKKRESLMSKETSEIQKKLQAERKASSGKIKLSTSYEYEGDLLTNIKGEGFERKFYYENGLMVKSEYYRNGELLNTRIHYYKNSLKDRTEIFNRYNEPEYTITYSYEFW